MKKIFFILLILGVSVFFPGCINDSYKNEMQTANEAEKKKMTVDEVVKSYESENLGKVIGVKEYKNHVLVEYINDADMRWFNWHNLKTGDRDSVGNMGTGSKLSQILSEDYLIFEADGVRVDNGHRGFPFLIECWRPGEATGYDGEFHNTRKEKYLRIDEEYEFGIKQNVLVSDIKVTLKGVEMLFAPMEGEEGSFYTAYTSIPVMKTAYVQEKNQFLVKLKGTKINPKLNKNNLKVQNSYVHSIELKESENDTIAAISLKEGANYYTARQGHLEPAIDDFPFVEFAFKNKVGD